MMDSSADEIDKGNKSSFSSFSRSYTPLLFYMDSTINYPGPILKGNKSTPLSSYTTILFSRPAPTDVSNMDIFVINKFYVPSKYHPLSFGMDPTHPGRLRIPYNLPCSTAVFSFGQSQSSKESKSESNSFGSFGESQSSEESKYIPDEVAFSILSKLSIKSLKRFGCVSKSWSILFENTHFMTMYSKHFISHHGSDDDYHTFILTNHHEDDDVFTTLNSMCSRTDLN
jgi:hypothetical protein